MLRQVVAGLALCGAASHPLLAETVRQDVPDSHSALLRSHLGRAHCWSNRLEMQDWLWRVLTSPFSAHPWLLGPPANSGRWQALAADGGLLKAAEPPVACTLDRSTGLLWASGLESAQAGHAWVRTGTNTAHPVIGELIEQANARQFCGVSRWRLPGREELLTLVDYRQPEFVTKVPGFDHLKQRPSTFWTATRYAAGPTPVLHVTADWNTRKTPGPVSYNDHEYLQVSLLGGQVSSAGADQAYLVLLVREQTCNAFGIRFWK